MTRHSINLLRNQRRLRLEQLEARHLLTAVPFGPEIVIDTNEASDILIVMADLDGDGDIDQIGGDDGLFWYENTDGDGTFSAPQTIATASQANNVRDIDVGDIDRDGDLDIVASSATGDKVQWWANDGAGGFGAAQNVVTGDNVGSSVALVDYDHDGDLDILANGDTVDWYANDGSGTFTAQSNFTFGMNFLDTADFDRDGSVDIVAADLANDSITLLTASGSASVAINNPGNLIAVDLDGDGDQDVVATSEGDGILVWYENDGSAGSFFAGNPSAQVIDGALSGAFDVRAGDFDADGDLDLLASGTAGDTVAWYENDGTVDPTFTRHTLTTTADGAENVAIADIDGDGDLDVSYVSSSDNRRVWRRNLAIHARPVINTQSETTIDDNFAGATTVTTADIDGDGDLDVLGAANTADDISWWENTAGDGSTWIEHTIDSSFDSVNTVMAADVDGDGDLDVLATASRADDITWWENTTGDGLTWTQRTINGSFDNASSVTAADVDGDGDLDVLGSGDGDITWWENTVGDGLAWTRRTIDGNYLAGQSVKVGDLDRDGDLDVIATSNLGSVRWWENTAGDGSAWTRRTISTSLNGGRSVTTADLDGDGDLDVLGGGLSSSLRWWENAAGDGLSWVEHIVDSGFFSVASATSADMDGDGDLDILATHSQRDDITWWENTDGDGLSWNKSTIDGSFDGSDAVATGDIDGDGDLDVIGAAFNANDIAWWENRREQLGLVTTSTAPTAILPGGSDDFLQIAMTHQGRAGDSAAELVSVAVRIETGAGDAFSSSQANDLFDNISLYLDDGNQSFDASDELVESVTDFLLTDGVLEIVLADGHPAAGFEVQQSKTFFVVPKLAEDAGAQPQNEFQLTHSTAGSTTTLAVHAGQEGGLLIDPVSGRSTPALIPTPLVVTSIMSLDTSPTDAELVQYSITFSRDVTGVAVDDFALTTTGLTTGNLAQVTELSPSSYVVTIDSLAGDGTLRLDLIDDDSIVDASGNPLGNFGIGNGNSSGSEYVIADPLLEVMSIEPLTESPTANNGLQFAVAFNKEVIGVDVSDFAVRTEGPVFASIATVTGSGSDYTVTLDNVFGAGSLRLELIDDDTIVDGLSLPLSGAGTGNGNFLGEAYFIDQLPPQVLGIVRFDAEPVFGAPLRFLVNFNESVSGVDATDFEITTSGTASGTIGTIIELLPSSYLVEIDNVSGVGTLGLNLIDDDSIVDTVVDPAPFPLGGVGTGNGDTIGQVYALTAGTSGDFDADGDVDGADFLAWQRGFGTTYDSSDLQDWENNYGTNPAPIGAAPIAQAIIQEPPSQAPSGAQLAVSHSPGSKSTLKMKRKPWLLTQQ